jgi:flagellar hook-length control protein FliK
MDDMRIQPGLLNATQTPARDSREQRQPDTQAAHAFDRLFEGELRAPKQERAPAPMIERNAERAVDRTAEHNADRMTDRAADRSADRTAQRNADLRTENRDQSDRRARDSRDSQGSRIDDASRHGAADQVRTPRGARSEPNADEPAKERLEGEATAVASQDGADGAQTNSKQLSLEAMLLPADGQPGKGQAIDQTSAQSGNAQLLDELQAASAALLQSAQGLATGKTTGPAVSAGTAKAAPVSKHIDGDTATTKAAKDSAAAAAELTAADANAPGAVRDRLLEDFERRFERSLAAAANTGREGFTPGSPQALASVASLAPGASPQQPLYSSAHANITLPISHPGFGDELTNRVLLFAGQRVQNAELAITPADLGPIKVSIELRGQEVSLAFTAQHASTRAAIEDALPKLREFFADQGLQLAQAHVGDQRRQDSGRYGSQDSHGGLDAARVERASSIGAGGTGGLPNAYGVRGVGLIDIHV